MLEDTFANRLKKALDYNNMKPVELANKTGINKSLISNYLSGSFKAKQNKLDVIARVLNVSEAWLMGYDVDMDREWFEEKEPSELTIDNARYIETTTKTIKIPLLGKVPAGVPIEAIEDLLGYEEIPMSMLRNGNDYFALKVEGDSMYPEYMSGDIIIVRQQPDCCSGDDCIVMVNGDDATFKRVVKQEKNIILKPLNSKYEPYVFSEYDIMTKPVKIIGIAIEVRRKVKR